ncbi:type II toxin-antitoxin system Phd/YefM family antitoxin [Lentibacillus sp. CBA3610]|uniref:type II toxin-antitoxin system Phd/YefM family antitoxin n=1 Tax=Lentibacillus sp. CBA3610 TaxID=2518176 RepID=UPI0015954647|nr:type II toxin-antitoxin system Phd/YefM family antitoxin [Lentibacillus sp. CBA3610]QKY70150.1 type II toxin-antitoxin system Phd/YefM family antitoxin [Lentibacillus sp. CBA3610]
MIVSSTEVKNNFGRYLMLAAKEEVIITKNGIEIARLQGVEGHSEAALKESSVREMPAPYNNIPKKATYEEFLALTRDEETRYEYIDGEIYLLASPRIGHQYASGALFGLFFNHFHGSQCTPFTAPCDIQLKRPNHEDPCVVQPDLMVICDLDDHLNDQDYYTGVPSLVVEILSESTQGKDLVKKLDLYMECGVKEYWIVDPSEMKVIIYYFQDYEIEQTVMCKPPETANSFLFEGLSVELEGIFRS